VTAPDGAALDPAELALALRVLEQANDLDPDHADKIALQRATAKLYKTVKKQRRDEAKRVIQEADRAVIEATATGSPTRIDDETAGIELKPMTTSSTFAGRLQKPQGCYVCKREYQDIDVFYHQLCPECAAFNRAKRDARTDLTGRRAVLTGGRAKIGMYIALRLLRDGAHTTITTRFPNDAIRRFAGMPDADDWLHRLKIVGIDLRDPSQVMAFADDVAAEGPLDILINNAAQTVRRSPGAYAPLAAAESAPLPAGLLPHVTTYGRSVDAHPASLEASVLDGARVTGAVLYGDVGDGPWYFDLIQRGADISAIRDRLLFGRALCEPA